MKLLSKKVLGIPLLGILLALVLVGVAVAAVLLSVPSSVNIVSKEIAVYSDSDCSIEVANLDWGDVAQGTICLSTVYVKNIGTGVVGIVSAEAVPLPTGVTFSAIPTIPLLAGQSAPMLLTLTVASDAPLGATNFTTNFAE